MCYNKFVSDNKLNKGEIMKVKRYLLVTLSAFFLVVLAACGSKTTSTPVKHTNFQQIDNVKDIRMVYYYKGDKVTKQTATNTIKYSAIGATNKDEAKAKLASSTKQYQGVKGLSESIDYKDTYLVEKVSVDYTKGDLDELSKINGVSINSNGKKISYISYKQSKKLLLNNGFKVVKNGQFKKLDTSK